MSDLIAVSVAYPAIVLTALVGLAIVYWLFVIVGALDLDTGADVDVDAGVDADAGGDADADADGHVHGLASVLSVLGVEKVPVTITFSFVSLFAWIICVLLMSWMGDADLPQWLLGTLILVASLVLALPPAALVARPLAPLFVVHKAKKRADYVGSMCQVTTGKVTDKFGQARIPDGGDEQIIQVRCDKGDVFSRHDKALIIDYDAAREAYLIEKLDELLADKSTSGA